MDKHLVSPFSYIITYDGVKPNSAAFADCKPPKKTRPIGLAFFNGEYKKKEN